MNATHNPVPGPHWQCQEIQWEHTQDGISSQMQPTPPGLVSPWAWKCSTTISRGSMPWSVSTLRAECYILDSAGVRTYFLPWPQMTSYLDAISTVLQATLLTPLLWVRGIINKWWWWWHTSLQRFQVAGTVMKVRAMKWIWKLPNQTVRLPPMWCKPLPNHLFMPLQLTFHF